MREREDKWWPLSCLTRMALKRAQTSATETSNYASLKLELLLQEIPPKLLEFNFILTKNTFSRGWPTFTVGLYWCLSETSKTTHWDAGNFLIPLHFWKNQGTNGLWKLWSMGLYCHTKIQWPAEFFNNFIPHFLNLKFYQSSHVFIRFSFIHLSFLGN